MSQADTTKSVITSLRYGLNLLVTITFVCIGLLVSDYRGDNIDTVTLVSFILAISAMITAIIVQKAINRKSKELEDM